MTDKFIVVIFLTLLFSLQFNSSKAQDRRAQYPGILSNSFVGVSIGYINYPFSEMQLEPGFHASSVNVPHAAVRLTLFGHQFNKWLSAQITYMRPVNWVEYKNVNNQMNHTVWMNIAGLSMKAQTLGTKKISVYGEAGLAIVTRHGFIVSNNTAIKHANYASILSGVGLQYHFNKKWDLSINAAYSPENKKVKQPHTLFYGAGFIYNMQPLSNATVQRNSNRGFIFPRNLLQIGYSTNVLGYGVNNAVSKGPVPVFWAGDAQIRQGVCVHYQKNIFHTRKVFSFDWGAAFSYWQSRRERDRLVTLSVFPLLRFTVIRSLAADLYFNYSVAGPSFISRTVVDGYDTGKHFTFQDFMGMGIFYGRKRNLNAEVRIAHYSNGNIFPQNVGVMIPLTFNLGYAF